MVQVAGSVFNAGYDWIRWPLGAFDADTNTKISEWGGKRAPEGGMALKWCSGADVTLGRPRSVVDKLSPKIT